MINTLIKGFIFGLGFSIALILIFYIWLNFTSSSFRTNDGPNLSDLSIEEKIEQSSMILRTTHSNEKSLIAEFVKRDPNVSFDYEIGDEFYPFGQHSDAEDPAGDGMIVFLTGSHALPKYGISYYQFELSRYDNDVISFLLSEKDY